MEERSRERVKMLTYFFSAFLLRGNRYFSIEDFPGASSLFWQNILNFALRINATKLPQLLVRQICEDDYSVAFSSLVPFFRTQDKLDYIFFSVDVYPFFEHSYLFLLPDQDKFALKPLVLSALAKSLDGDYLRSFIKNSDESNKQIHERAIQLFQETRCNCGLENVRQYA